MWILATKPRIPKIQFIDNMKLKKKEDQSVDTLDLLRRGTKYPWEEIQRQSVQPRIKERPFRVCPTWGSIPTKPPTKEYTLLEMSPSLIFTWVQNTNGSGFQKNN